MDRRQIHKLENGQGGCAAQRYSPAGAGWEREPTAGRRNHGHRPTAGAEARDRQIGVRLNRLLSGCHSVSHNDGHRAGRFVGDLLLRLLRSRSRWLARGRLFDHAISAAATFSDNHRRCIRLALKVASNGLLRYRCTERQRSDHDEPAHDPILRAYCHTSPNLWNRTVT